MNGILQARPTCLQKRLIHPDEESCQQNVQDISFAIDFRVWALDDEGQSVSP